MIKCIFDKLCEMLGLLEEKLEQLCEVVLQQDAVCEKLEVLLDPDVECPDCPITEHVFLWSGFDESGDVFDTDYIHQSTVNGTAYSNPFSAGWTNKSEAYETTTDAVNAIAGTSMVLQSDVPIGENGKPSYLITIPAGDTLEIVNTFTGDVLTFSTAEDGSCVGTFQNDQGEEISSYSPVEQ